METAIALFWIILKIIGWFCAGLVFLFAIMVIMAVWLIPDDEGYYHDHMTGFKTPEPDNRFPF